MEAQLLQARLQNPQVFQEILDTQFEIDARSQRTRESQLYQWFPDHGEFARDSRGRQGRALRF